MHLPFYGKLFFTVAHAAFKKIKATLKTYRYLHWEPSTFNFLFFIPGKRTMADQNINPIPPRHAVAAPPKPANQTEPKQQETASTIRASQITHEQKQEKAARASGEVNVTA